MNLSRFFFAFTLLVFAWEGKTNQSGFFISKDVKENKNLTFIPHQGDGRFDSYLSLEIPFLPVAELFKEILISNRQSLASRGEAHITVITPIEFFDILKARLTINEINELALKEKIQASTYDFVCLGRGETLIDGKKEYTYYAVVTAESLLKIRRKIKALFVHKGGEARLFDAEKYYPHITVGFTKRDLHESDGVIKDKSTCWASLKELP